MTAPGNPRFRRPAPSQPAVRLSVDSSGASAGGQCHSLASASVGTIANVSDGFAPRAPIFDRIVTS